MMFVKLFFEIKTLIISKVKKMNLNFTEKILILNFLKQRIQIHRLK